MNNSETKPANSDKTAHIDGIEEAWLEGMVAVLGQVVTALPHFEPPKDARAARNMIGAVQDCRKLIDLLQSTDAPEPEKIKATLADLDKAMGKL